MNQTIDKDERSWFDRGYPGITAIYGSTYQHERKGPVKENPKKKGKARGKYKYTVINLKGEKVFSGNSKETGSFLGVRADSVNAAYIHGKKIRKSFTLKRVFISTAKPKKKGKE